MTREMWLADAAFPGGRGFVAESPTRVLYQVRVPLLCNAHRVREGEEQINGTVQELPKPSERVLEAASRLRRFQKSEFVASIVLGICTASHSP